MRQAGLGHLIEYVGYGAAVLLAGFVFIVFASLRHILRRHDEGRISSYTSGRNTIFKVRQRRFDRLLKLSYLVAGAGAFVYLIVSMMRADWTAPLLLLGILALLAIVAAVFGLFPALWALKESSVSTFVVADDGLVLAGGKGSRTTLDWRDMDGPYYSVTGQLERPAGSSVYAGVGVSGVAFVGAHAVSNATTESVMAGINVVRSGTGGRVYFKHRGQRVDLARLLSGDEAEFLAHQVAEAAARAAS